MNVVVRTLATLAAGLALNVAAPALASDDPGLEATRQALEEAARQLAELGTRLGADALELADRQMMTFSGRRAMLGIAIDDEKHDEGVVIQAVTPGGPADSAGLRSGDVIVAVEGSSLRRDADGSPTSRLLDLMQDVEPGQTLTMEYRRGDQTSVTSVTVEAFDAARLLGLDGDDFDLSGMLGGLTSMGRFQSRWGRMELVTLTRGLGEYFGTDDGLLVVRAPDDPDIPLQDGDVIQRIDGRTPMSPSHALKILRSYEEGEAFSIEVVRRQRAMTLDIELSAHNAQLDDTRFQPSLPAVPAGEPLGT